MHRSSMTTADAHGFCITSKAAQAPIQSHRRGSRPLVASLSRHASPMSIAAQPTHTPHAHSPHAVRPQKAAAALSVVSAARPKLLGAAQSYAGAGAGRGLPALLVEADRCCSLRHSVAMGQIHLQGVINQV